MGRDDAETKVRPVRIARGPNRSQVACLEVLGGQSRGRVLALTTGTTLMGRASTCDLSLDDDGLSRQHAKLSISDDGIVNLLDLGSTNGTYLNNARIDMAIVREGDRIQLGPEAILRFDYRSRDEVARAAEQEPAIELRPREREVAVLVAEGLTNAEIAKKLFISPRTVTTHLGNIYERLGKHSRAALTRYVLEHDIRGP